VLSVKPGPVPFASVTLPRLSRSIPDLGRLGGHDWWSREPGTFYSSNPRTLVQRCCFQKAHFCRLLEFAKQSAQVLHTLTFRLAVRGLVLQYSRSLCISLGSTPKKLPESPHASRASHLFKKRDTLLMVLDMGFFCVTTALILVPSFPGQY
jgi:hypothetical protein